MVRPEVVAHEQQQIRLEQRHNPFCIGAGIGWQIENGGSVGEVFPGVIAGSGEEGDKNNQFRVLFFQCSNNRTGLLELADRSGMNP